MFKLSYNDSYVSEIRNEDVKLYTSFPVFHDTKFNSLKIRNRGYED